MDLRVGERVFITQDPYYGHQGIVTGGGVEMPGLPETYMVRTGLGTEAVEVEVPRASVVTVAERQRGVRGF